MDHIKTKTRNLRVTRENHVGSISNKILKTERKLKS